MIYHATLCVAKTAVAVEAQTAFAYLGAYFTTVITAVAVGRNLSVSLFRVFVRGALPHTL